jgi:transcriptional regulator with XRE-family HTH domain
MNQGESPAVARRRLRLALRKAREAKKLTQQEVAEALDWSLSKVNRIESGDVTVSSTDLQALLRYFGIEDPDRVEQMTEDAKTSRRRGWWDEPKYREHLTPGTLQLLQFESEATFLRVFQATLVPGLLQTREYAEAVLDYWKHDLRKEDREARLEVRMRRGEQLFGRPDPPHYLLLLDESVLHREAGGHRVMADQLQALLDLSRTSALTVRVLPLADAAVMATLGPFQIFDFGDEENAVLYRENYLQDEIIHTAEIVKRQRRIFEQFWNSSLTEEASAGLIEARAAAMRAATYRRPAT